jgi:hypothetical protein
MVDAEVARVGLWVQREGKCVVRSLRTSVRPIMRSELKRGGKLLMSFTP